MYFTSTKYSRRARSSNHISDSSNGAEVWRVTHCITIIWTNHHNLYALCNWCNLMIIYINSLTAHYSIIYAFESRSHSMECVRVPKIPERSVCTRFQESKHVQEPIVITFICLPDMFDFFILSLSLNKKSLLSISKASTKTVLLIHSQKKVVWAEHRSPFSGCHRIETKPITQTLFICV